MKSNLLFLSLVVLFASCSTAYKTGQTPDDVYFSPQRQQAEYVRVNDKDDRSYQSDERDREDRYLRMKTRNRRYVLLENECDCYCTSGYGYKRYNDYYRYNNYGTYTDWRYLYGWNNYYNNYYNPYYKNAYYTGYSTTNNTYKKPRKTNFPTYDNSNNGDRPSGNSKTSTTNSNSNTDNYRGSGTSAGNFLRDVFGTGNSSDSKSNSSGSSTNSSSSTNNSNSKSNSSGSSNAPVRKF